MTEGIRHPSLKWKIKEQKETSPGSKEWNAPLRQWLGSEKRFPELKEGFVYCGKIWGRKLLRGLLSFPVHMEIHYVLATVLDQNLRFRNSLSCVLGKGEGCVVYLCARWGWRRGGGRIWGGAI